MDSTRTPAPSRRDLITVAPEDAGIDRPGLKPGPNGERPHNEPFQSVLAVNLERRMFLKGTAAMVPVLMAGGTSLLAPTEARSAGADKLAFKAIAPSTVDEIVVPKRYKHQVLIRWGDPMFPGAPAYDPNNQSAAAQRQQFGYNCDFIGYFPLDDDKRALLCVNHEYTNGADMIPGYVAGASKEHVDIELAAHGGSVIEINRDGNRWKVNKQSRYSRRILGDTPMLITGPAAGHPLMQTKADPTGTSVLGMLNNCAGGKTPWGTWLTCEENFDQYFANNDLVGNNKIRNAHARYGLPGGASSRQWENFYNRFDLSKEPKEPFRFGWVVEIDPYDPNFTPRKRTALGRIKHEGATTVLAASGQVVVYTGDDQRFDYVYKFVTRKTYNPAVREANFGLLDEGTLYVAKFNADGTGEWIALDIKNPTLAAKFDDQGEILIKTRQAADAVGATAMDRPEDLQVNPVSGKVYLTMTNNSARTTVVADAGSAAANPRVPNFNGHIIELTERNNDYTGRKFTWDIFLLCGNASINLQTNPAALIPGLPSNVTFFAGFAQANKLGKIAAPDNITFDGRGNLWIATDGQPFNTDIGNVNDAIHAVPTAGPDRGYLRQFLAAPKGAEVCGPEFSADERTLFCAIQHPGEDGGIPNGTSSWPDGDPIPRPSVVVVRHKDGKRIGE